MLQDQLSLKTEQLRVGEEKSKAQSDLMAITKRKMLQLEKEVSQQKERNDFMH